MLVDTRRYIGFADRVTHETITGFALDMQDIAVPVLIKVQIDGEYISTLECSGEHREIKKARSTGKYPANLPENSGGFSFTIPNNFIDGLSHRIEMVFEDNTKLLFPEDTGVINDCYLFSVQPETMLEGHVDGVASGGIHGWILRTNPRTGEKTGNIPLVVSCNGTPIAEIVADRVRVDVAQAKNSETTVGFSFKPEAKYRNGRQHTFSFHSVPEGYELLGSPYTTSFISHDAVGKLIGIDAKIEELFSQLWLVSRQLKQVLPSGEFSVSNYDGWARQYYADLQARTANQRDPELLKSGPLISIICPAYKPRMSDFIAAVSSVQDQTYQNWELIVVDDSSKSDALTEKLDELSAADRRIKVIRHKTNRGISAATNTAVKKARGSWIALFDHDDFLVNVALEVMMNAAKTTGARFLYSDEDKIDDTGILSEPNLKSDWNRRLLLSQNYICHFVMAQKSLFKKIGDFNSSCDGAQDHDFFLRASELLEDNEIYHVPELLYHWRKTPQSTAGSSGAKTYTVNAGQLAVASHLSRKGLKAQVSAINNFTMYRVNWRFAEEPAVTIIIPFKDQIDTTRKCVDYVLANTSYQNYRIVLVDNWSQTAIARRYCREIVRDPRVKVLRIEENFNYSRLNNLAASSFPSPYYCFLNNDVFITQKDWLQALMGECLADARVGAVGAKLLYPNGTLQHAGVILGVGGVADHAFKGLQSFDPGYVGRAACAQELSAVTAACMLCKAEAFQEVGKFDEQDLKVAFNDVDLCLKLNAMGWRVIYTPNMVAEHHESLSRGEDISPTKLSRFFEENRVMEHRWGDRIKKDPFYSRHFSRADGIFRDLAEFSGKD